MSSRYPLKRSVTMLVGALAAAVNASLTVGRAPFTGKITSVSYVPNALITGAATNNRTISIKNRGQAGAGALVPASLQFVNAVNAPAFDEKPLTVSATPADVAVTAGDIISFESQAVGTGLADPGGMVIVEFLLT